MSTALPESHPPVGAGSANAKCPVAGLTHEFIPAKEGDSRSPCPALNALANHGYLPHDGRNISAWDVVKGLREGYGLSTPFAAFLSYGGFWALSKLGKRIELHDLAIHNKIEHDGSLVHHDTPAGEQYAPIQIDPELVKALVKDVRPTEEEVEAKKANGENAEFLFGLEDVARARVRREKECRPLGRLKKRVARGEMALSTCIFGKTVGDKSGIPVEMFRTWIQEERLPEGWKPNHVQGFFGMFNAGNKIMSLMNGITEEEARSKKAV